MRPLFLILSVVFIYLPVVVKAQMRVVRGTVIDQSSNAPVPFANVMILKTNPLLGAVTDSLGNFRIPNVPVGRYDIQASVVGYQPYIIKEVDVFSSKEVILTFAVKEKNTNLSEVVVAYKAEKEKPLNSMATLSARMLSVEEAKRYAGGFDDPARLASSFAGVSSNVSSNGIVVRGNAPQYLQWKLEGIEIPNPNHFADLQAFGGGGLTALSSNLLANSDFFTGAFPAEYNNALSGVFDIFMRTGNNQQQENSLSVGAIGIDVSSEGPLKKGGKASYLFNYRYSTLALISSMLPDDIEGIKYQDLSFKLNFPTKKAGTFSLWGIGLIDRSGGKAEMDSSKWEYNDDKQEQDVKQYMGAFGLTHKYLFNNNAYLKTTLATTVTSMDYRTDRLNSIKQLTPRKNIQNTSWDFTLSSMLNKKFSSKHTNRTGILVRGMAYNLDLGESPSVGTPLETIVSADGFSALLSAYSSSSIDLMDKVTMNAGINGQVFTLNNHYTIEPRIGVKWQFRQNQSLGLAYGLHSRMEKINYYLNRSLSTGKDKVNKDLDFTKAHHLVLGYDWNINDVLHMKVETYFQQLYNVPVIADSSFSFTNMTDDWFFAEKLVNKGEGRNYGIDITFEKYMSAGYYFLFTSSLFNSEYKGGDGIWRDTRYNRNYLFNFLIGKEWKAGRHRQDVFSLNGRFTYQGGDHYSPILLAESIREEDVVYDERRAFENQANASFIAHFTASYKLNRKRPQEISLKVINVTQQKDFYGHKYNYLTRTVDTDEEALFIPNISYRIDF